MNIGQNLIKKYQDGGAIYSAGEDYTNPLNFALYNYLSGLSPEDFADAMQANFGMISGQGESGEDLDYSMLFQQYDPQAQDRLGTTYKTAIGKAEGKSRNTLEEAFRMARSGKSGFGGLGSSLKEAFNRAFKTRSESGDVARQQYESGTFDLQSDYVSNFEDLLAQLSGQGVEFQTDLIDSEWAENQCPEGQTWNSTTASCVDPAVTTDLIEGGSEGETGGDIGTGETGSGGIGGTGTNIVDNCSDSSYAAAHPSECGGTVGGGGGSGYDLETNPGQMITGSNLGAQYGGSFGGYTTPFGGQ